MPTINISRLVPWDLTLQFEGQPYATVRPTLAGLAELSAAEKVLESGTRDWELLTRTVRGVVKRFFPEAIHAALDAASYDDLYAAFTACSAYFGDWFKKKRLASQAAALGTTVPNPPSTK